ncbi:TIGR04066 family peptide maturation system protein [Paenibacillus sp. Marseille-Q9583]
MKKKLAVYPFHKGLMPLLLTESELQNFELMYAVVPKGWESFDEVDDTKKALICDEESFYLNDLINSVDVLLLCKPQFQVDESGYCRLTSLAEEKGKHIMYVAELKTVLNQSTIEGWECLNLEHPSISKQNALASIDVPVILIMGMGENCGKWNLQLKLSENFRNSGYKMSLISSNALSRLWGYHTIPDIIDGNDLTFSEQVESMNAYIKYIEQAENPDVIIIGVPGSILKYSTSVPNGYGYIPFLISNAVTPDITILSLYNGNYEESHLKEMKSTCLYKYGVNIDYYHISENVCLYNPEARQLEYYSVDYRDLVENNSYSHEGMHTFNLSNSTSQEEAFIRIISELQNNIPMI